MGEGMAYLAHTAEQDHLARIFKPLKNYRDEYVCLFVCLFAFLSVYLSVGRSVCPLAYLENRTAEFHQFLARRSLSA